MAIATCPEDLNGNGAVDFADILVVIAFWGPCASFLLLSSCAVEGEPSTSDRWGSRGLRLRGVVQPRARSPFGNPHSVRT